MIVIATQTFAPAKGGMEAYMTGLAEHLCSRKFETFVFADEAKTDYSPSCDYTLFRFGGWRPWRRMKKRIAITKFAHDHSIEGIFCDSWKSVEAVPMNTRCPIAAFAHGSEFPSKPSIFKRKRIEKALARCSAIIANSQYTANAARAFLPDNDTRLVVINPPIDPIPPASEAANQKIAALLKGKKPVISTIARLEPRKGADRVIMAIPNLAKKHPDVVFLIGGDGEDKQRLQDLAEKLNVSDRVVFHGWVNDADTKAAILSHSDVFAMPAYRVGSSVEGFGISYVEAAWFGVPSVAGNDGGAADAVTDGKTGILCDASDFQEVGKALDKILSDIELRSRMSDDARHKAETEHTWTTALPLMLTALHQ